MVKIFADTSLMISTSLDHAVASEILAAEAKRRRKAVFLAKRGKGRRFQYLNKSDCKYRRTIFIFHLGCEGGGGRIRAEKDRTKNFRQLLAPHESRSMG
jgi:hypothetical protein